MASPVNDSTNNIKEQSIQHIEIEDGVNTVHLHLKQETEFTDNLQVRLSVSSEGLDNPEASKFVHDFNLKGKKPVRSRNAQNGADDVDSTLMSTKKTIAGKGLHLYLFIGAMVLYLLVRLIGLEEYPIYFFTDEAIQTNLAADFLRDGMKSADGEWLPTYFYNSYQYNLSFSVYLQIIPYLIFGRSVLITRGISVLVSLLAALYSGLILKDIFKLPNAWVGILMLSFTPAWFLHSRTAFETSLATTFFAAFLYYYAMYRTREQKFLYLAVMSAALMFYSYSPARMVIGLTALLLFLIDIKYHWKNRGIVLKGFGQAMVLALPLFRFLYLHPNENIEHLMVLNSYWVKELPLIEKLLIFFGEYLQGLDPLYWFMAHDHDLARHQMNGYGHIFAFSAPFLLLGILYCFKHFRNPGSRIVMIALLAAPSGAALVHIGITRALSMVIPAALLTSIGLITGIGWLQSRFNVSGKLTAAILFLILSVVNIFLLRDALVNGPFWHDDYGLGGMQFGAIQLFSKVDDYLEENPDTQMLISPSWANGTDHIAQFFFGDQPPFEMGSIEGYLHSKKELNRDMLFVMIPEEMSMVRSSGKFRDVVIEDEVKYPDGKTGFYFVRLDYIDSIDVILQQEKAERRVLREANLDVMGFPAQVRYSFLDMGSIEDAFDGDKASIIRTMEANPLQIEIKFDDAHNFHSADLRIGGTATEVSINLVLENGDIVQFVEVVDATANPRTLSLDFDKIYSVREVNIDIRNVLDSEPAHVHLWEVILNE